MCETEIYSAFQVRSVFVDTKQEGVVYPNVKPRLYDLKGKDPIAIENAGHVSYALTVLIV